MKYSLLVTVLSVFLIPSASANKIISETIRPEIYIANIERTGKLNFKRTVNLSFKSHGYLEKLSVDAGDTFSKGQLLASLDNEQLLANKNSNYAVLLLAKKEVHRVKTLIANNLSSAQELDSAKTKVETARANYKVSFYDLEKAIISAGFDGIVLARNTELGEYQSPGVEVLRVANLKNNWVVKVALTSSEISQVKIGQVVKVNLSTMGYVEGVVNRLPAIANTNGHLFTIDILLPHLTLQSGIVAGQIADVIIDYKTDNLVYKIPIEALMAINYKGQALVLVEPTDGKPPFQQAFDIYKMNSQYLFLVTNHTNRTLNIVTKGWQKIELGR